MSERMRLAVCECGPEMVAGDPAWRALVGRVRTLRPDALLLNELPFGAWIAAGERRDARVLRDSQRLHEAGVSALDDLGVPLVMGSRATVENGRSVNQGFVWEAERGLRAVHTKQFLPEESGYYEARWYERGETHFRVAEVRDWGVGFLICTEVMFNEWARAYGRAGAHLIVVPRATPRPSLERWKVAIRMAALVSGCWVASSNRAGTDSGGQEFGGCGWIVDPDGEVIGETSAEEPVVTAEIDRAIVAAAKREYPRYVADLT